MIKYGAQADIGITRLKSYICIYIENRSTYKCETNISGNGKPNPKYLPVDQEQLKQKK